LVSEVKILGYMLFAVGFFICSFNFYLSFIHYWVYYLLGKEDRYQWSSGFPVFGSLFLLVSLAMFSPPWWLVVLGIIACLLDTGGLHWFVFSVLWYNKSEDQDSQRQ
jgi:hypothetical protein